MKKLCLSAVTFMCVIALVSCVPIKNNQNEQKGETKKIEKKQVKIDIRKKNNQKKLDEAFGLDKKKQSKTDSVKENQAENKSSEPQPDTEAFQFTKGGESFLLKKQNNWQKASNPKMYNDEAVIALSHDQKDFIFAILEDKAALDSEQVPDVTAYTRFFREVFAEDVTDEQVHDIEVNGMKGKVFETSKQVESIKVSYIVYILETKNNFIQLIGYTTEEDFVKDRNDIIAEMQTFELDH